MIIGNKTDTPRSICIGDEYHTIPPMGFITLPDDVDTKAHVDALMATRTVKQLIDMNVLCFNRPNDHAAPTVVEGPKPPAELLQEPENQRVTRDKPRKTKETMKV